MTAQERYKRKYDKRIRTTLRVSAGDKFFLANPPGLSHADANREDVILQTKMMSPTSDPHDAIRSTDTTVTIAVDGVH